LPSWSSTASRPCSGPLRDAEHGGWFAAPHAIDGNTGKAAYLHAFVALAASSAVVAGVSRRQALLDDAIRSSTAFLGEEEGAMRESFARDWSGRGLPRRQQQHARHRSLSRPGRCHRRHPLAGPRPAHRRARDPCPPPANGSWSSSISTPTGSLLPDYNRDNPADGFRPYGTTPGHGFEWARLLLHLEAARLHAGLPRRTGC
jgi:mannose/cellobiose epimerase-like protein (N-acyl-D-glucosamine 2-epimerase family)